MSNISLKFAEEKITLRTLQTTEPNYDLLELKLYQFPLDKLQTLELGETPVICPPNDRVAPQVVPTKELGAVSRNSDSAEDLLSPDFGSSPPQGRFPFPFKTQAEYESFARHDHVDNQGERVPLDQRLTRLNLEQTLRALELRETPVICPPDDRVAPQVVPTKELEAVSRNSDSVEDLSPNSGSSPPQPPGPPFKTFAESKSFVMRDRSKDDQETHQHLQAAVAEEDLTEHDVGNFTLEFDHDLFTQNFHQLSRALNRVRDGGKVSVAYTSLGNAKGMIIYRRKEGGKARIVGSFVNAAEVRNHMILDFNQRIYEIGGVYK